MVHILTHPAVRAVAIGVSTLAGPSDAGQQSEKKNTRPRPKEGRTSDSQVEVRATLEGPPVNCLAVLRDDNGVWLA